MLPINSPRLCAEEKAALRAAFLRAEGVIVHKKSLVFAPGRLYHRARRKPWDGRVRRPERDQMKHMWMRQTAAVVLAALLLMPAALAAEEGSASAPAAPAVEETGETAWQLALVNPWTPLPETFQVELKALKNGLLVDQRIYEDLETMLNDCWAAGLSPVVCSAYRTQATQTRLFNNKVARLRNAGYSRETARTEAARWVAVPGTSEHQTGLALDIVSMDYQVLDEKQAETPEQQWLMEHCWEYGFILRYPEDKCALTGIGYEPWHYRYVGRETASALRESGLCLEEHLGQLPPAGEETA